MNQEKTTEAYYDETAHEQVTIKQNGQPELSPQVEAQPATPSELGLPWPLRLRVSGLYTRKPRRAIFPGLVDAGDEALDNETLIEDDGLDAFIPSWFSREELRLDVDGRYPQMTASGTIKSIFHTIHWIARLKAVGNNTWTGRIWYKRGNLTAFPYTAVRIRAAASIFPGQRRAQVVFSGSGVPHRVRTYSFSSTYFHRVNFEFDFATGEAPTTFVNTCAHPNRPASLPCETLTVQEVYQRAGFDVSTASGGVVPIAGAGVNALWSDQEMHDAMQTYWSHFDNNEQWAMWVFFASLHEQGTSLGGKMFDDIGPNHRQGTAIFNDSFIANPPAGDLAPAAWIQRMRFWTACHEMGHGFNLAHSWQKSLGAPWGTPWIPLADEPEARSFMNYPYGVSGGQTAFFADFEYRFSNGELLFMRHAPAQFVQMGNADWFDHHGFEQANVSPEPALRLELRVNRDQPIFEFMEPPSFELKLTNISGQPQLVDERILSDLDKITVILKRDGQPARQFAPFDRACWAPNLQTLMPNESLYEALPVSAGLNGWGMAEPGYYSVQVALHLDEEDIVSNPLRVRITPPRNYDEEYVAQDFFTEDVGRIVALHGSRFLTNGNDVLREVATKLANRRVALHAAFALGNVLTRNYKQLTLVDDGPERLQVAVQSAQVTEAQQLLTTALTAQAPTAVESFGHIRCHHQVQQFSQWLAEQGEAKAAAQSVDSLYQAMANRKVNGRPILPSVLKELKAKRDSYQ